MVVKSDFAQAKIIDLGMAGRFKQGGFGGTPLYNSPEKINGEARGRAAAHDAWAFALTIVAIEAKRDYML